MRIAIIGGGAAGLSMARLLCDQMSADIDVFEAQSRVGGKSWSFTYGGAVAELGTCYTTLSHGRVKTWMKEAGIRLIRNGPARFDRTDFMSYVRTGGGPPFGIQVARYLLHSRRIQTGLEAQAPPQRLVEEAAMPVGDWTRANGLQKMEYFMHRALTVMGYGFVDETPTIQALRWVDFGLLASGALGQLHMPEQGWSDFWNRFSQSLTVRRESPVIGVSRGPDAVIVETPDATFEYDQIVCAIPIDEFVPLTEPTKSETLVNEGVLWNGYATTLIASENWFTDWQVENYSNAVLPTAQLGQLVAARREGYAGELGGHLYIVTQLSKGLDREELRDIMRAELERRGVRASNIIEQKIWKYFPQYDRAAIEAGLLSTLRDMQGDQRTWYTGATFSHEAVSHIVNFNVGLARRMRQALQRAGGRSR